MSTAEKYARAIRSSHLEMSTIEADDVEMLIAAGKLNDGIGPSLLRLRAERDSISKLPGARLMARALKSMAGTRQLLIDYGSQNSNYPADSIELRNIVDAVLDLYLEPNCPPCGGTGKVGPYGAAQAICPACEGKTKRAVMWPTQESEALAWWLAQQMSEKTDTALRRIRFLLKE